MRDYLSIGNFLYWYKRIYEYIFASGAAFEYHGLMVKEIGIPWFFFALFLSKVIYSYICVNFSGGGAAHYIMDISHAGDTFVPKRMAYFFVRYFISDATVLLLCTRYKKRRNF